MASIFSKSNASVTSHSHVEIHDLVQGSTAGIDSLVDLYQELFPQYTRYIPIMRRRALGDSSTEANSIEHQWLIEVERQPAALAVFKYIPDRNLGILLDLGVKPSFRPIAVAGCCRFAEYLIGACLTQLRRDSDASDRPTPVGMIAEVESPRLVEQYRTYGFVVLPVDYWEPPAPMGDSGTQEPGAFDRLSFRQMHLGLFPLDLEEIEPRDPALIDSILTTVLCDHYHLPEDHWVLQNARASAELSAYS